MVGGGEYSPPPGSYNSNSMNEPAGVKKMKKKNKNQRRFSDEQIRTLELLFESETRLEPRKKIQLARELGLQPRQVAIWFQNKRARWKSKELEKEFYILRADFDDLSSQHELLKKEKLALAAELQNLNELMQKSGIERRCCVEVPALSSTGRDSDNGDNRRFTPELKPGNYENGPAVSDDETLKAEYLAFGKEPEVMNIVQPADSSLTSSDDWIAFESDPLLDQSCSSTYPWWDFWS